MQLDARQRAMLAEMGVALWQPQQKAVAAAPAPVVAEPAIAVAPQPADNRVAAVIAQQALQAMRQPAAAVLPAASALGSIPNLADMDLSALRQAASACNACGLHAKRTHSVWCLADVPSNTERWLFVLDQPGVAENRTGQPAQGDVGRLLANMAAAVGLKPEQVLISHALRCAPDADTRAQPQEVQTCRAWLLREIALLQPQVVLALGRQAAYAVLQSTQAIGSLRGHVHAMQEPDLAHIPVVVSFPLDHLLRSPESKAKAWSDLCLALTQTVLLKAK